MNVKEAERQVLGGILFDEAGCELAFEILRPEHFSDTFFKTVFEAMLKLREDGQEITIISLSSRKVFEEFAMECAVEIVTIGGLKTHINIIIDAYYLRLAGKGGDWLKEAVTKEGANVKDILIGVEQIALKLADRTNDKGLEHISKVGRRVVDDLEGRTQGKISGVSTGFDKLDENGFMFRNGTLNIIAGRPSMGKSALALDIARQCNKNVAFFSLEMASEELYERLISTETGVTNDDLMDGSAIKMNTGSIMNAIDLISGNRLWIDDGAYKTPYQILSQSKRLKAQHGIDMILIDYIQLLKLGGKVESRRQELGEISKILKRTAKELNIPVVALAQLNRDCEQRPDKRPLLSDLKESGEMEQDAHQVWFIFREEVYDESAEEGKAEVLVRKNRSGRIGKVNLTFQKERTHFKTYEPPPPDPFDEPKPLPSVRRAQERNRPYSER